MERGANMPRIDPFFNRQPQLTFIEELKNRSIAQNPKATERERKMKMK